MITINEEYLTPEDKEKLLAISTLAITQEEYQNSLIKPRQLDLEGITFVAIIEDDDYCPGHMYYVNKEKWQAYCEEVNSDRTIKNKYQYLSAWVVKYGIKVTLDNTGE